MKTIALSARVDELNELADHVPVSVLASRLLAVVETYLEANKAPAGTETMAVAFRTLDTSVIARRGPEEASLSFRDRIPELISEYEKSQPPVGDEHFYVALDVGRRTLLAEAAAEVAEAKLAHNEEGYDPEDVPPQEREPATTKPGPAEGPCPAEDSTRNKPPAGASDSTRGQGEEPEKPCKNCGQIKPLSEFFKNRQLKDGHANECKDCKNERQRRNYHRRKSREEVAELPQRQPEERLCAAGTRCVEADPDDLVPTPAVLDAADDHPSGLCRDCQKKAGIV